MKLTTLVSPTILLFSILLFGCGGGEKSTENSTITPSEETKVEESPSVVDTSTPEDVKSDEIAVNDSQELTGEDKVADSDCLSCHMVERKVIGPSYQDVAAEYENNEANVNMLVKKIIEGGVGVWGEVAMPPHATLSEEDAKDMVRYILSINPH